jgi:hypothetical protein
MIATKILVALAIALILVLGVFISLPAVAIYCLKAGDKESFWLLMIAWIVTVVVSTLGILAYCGI